MTTGLVWTGKFNKSTETARFGASVFLTIDRDYAWAIWPKPRQNVGRRPLGGHRLLACGRCLSEAEAMEAAAKWIGDTQ